MKTSRIRIELKNGSYVDIVDGHIDTNLPSEDVIRIVWEKLGSFIAVREAMNLRTGQQMTTSLRQALKGQPEILVVEHLWE